MSDNDALGRVQRIRGSIRTGRENIASWNNVVPNLEKTDGILSWIEDTIGKAPVTIAFERNETFIDYLDKTEHEMGILVTIPRPPENFVVIVNSSGTAVMSVYAQAVEGVPNIYPGEGTVLGWANETLMAGFRLQTEQNRTEIVRQRLSQLKSFLPGLHEEATHAAYSAQAGTQNPIEAAATLNRLLEQLKGALIDKCKSGKGTTYQRISDNLAANSPLTKTVIADGQATYDSLNQELMEIRKHITAVSGGRMVELLHKLEEHVIVITDALDPTAIGITFVS